MRDVLISGEKGIVGVRVRARARGTVTCPFTRSECDGGTVYEDGTIGCGFRETPDSECEWMTDLSDGQSPRDYYNELLMEAMR